MRKWKKAKIYNENEQKNALAVIYKERERERAKKYESKIRKKGKTVTNGGKKQKKEGGKKYMKVKRLNAKEKNIATYLREKGKELKDQKIWK